MSKVEARRQYQLVSTLFGIGAGSLSQHRESKGMGEERDWPTTKRQDMLRFTMTVGRKWKG